MDNITRCLDDLKYVFPKTLLDLAFLDSNRRMQTVNSGITNTIMYAKVLRDMELTGGVFKVINLRDCKVTYIGQNDLLVEVPSHILSGRKILSALVLTELYEDENTLTGQIWSHSGYTVSKNGPMNPIVDSTRGYRVDYNPRIELIDYNSFYVYGVGYSISSLAANVQLSNPSISLNGFDVKYYDVFKELTIYAIQAYIYMLWDDVMDRAFVRSGQRLETFNDKISTYSEANSLYNSKLKKWKKISKATDKVAMQNNINAAVGVYL